MKVKIHSRNFDTEFKTALFAMCEFAMAKLVPSKRLRDNIKIDVHFRHHLNDGEAMLHKDTNRYRPRHFKVVVDHHRHKVDDYGRERDVTEWGHRVLQTLAHELVHVKQYVTSELVWRYAGLLYKGVNHAPDNLVEYFDLPYEIEAYGRERGLLVTFLAFWKQIVEENNIEF